MQKDKSKANLDFWKEVKLTGVLSFLPSGYFETIQPEEKVSFPLLVRVFPSDTDITFSLYWTHGTANKNDVASTPSTVYIALVLKFTKVTCLLD